MEQCKSLITTIPSFEALDGPGSNRYSVPHLRATLIADSRSGKANPNIIIRQRSLVQCILLPLPFRPKLRWAPSTPSWFFLLHVLSLTPSQAWNMAETGLFRAVTMIRPSTVCPKNIIYHTILCGFLTNHSHRPHTALPDSFSSTQRSPPHVLS